MRVLQMAFSTDADMRPYPTNTSWTDAVYDQVLGSRVLFDMNVRGGGEEVRVDVSACAKHHPEPNVIVFSIPPNLLGNRAVISVLEFTYRQGLNNLLTATMGPMGFNNVSRPDFMSAATRMVNSLSSVDTQGNATADIIGPYTIRVRDEARVIDVAAVRLLVENDSNLANIKIPYWDAFANLVVMATKSYIYNKLRTEIPMGAMLGGQSLGVISEVVSEYADAEELYGELLKKWAKVAIMNDRTRYDRILQPQVIHSL